VKPVETLEELFAAMDAAESTPPRLVTIPKFGAVYIREITIGEVDDQIADTSDAKNKRGVARGACRLLCDSTGKRLMDPANEAHVDRMAKQPLRVLQAINKAAEEDPKN